MTMGPVIWREPVVRQVLYGRTGMVGRFLQQRGRTITSLARAQVGSDTGLLRSSIHMRHYRDPRGQSVRIGSSVAHAMEHHEGTPPRLIKPNQPKGVLRFATKGQIVFAHVVQHPGTPANRYLTDNMKKVMADTYR